MTKKLLTSQNSAKTNSVVTQIFLLLWIIQGFITLVLIALQPSEIDNRFIWNYSAPRFIVLLAITFIVLTGAVLYAKKSLFQNAILKSPWKETLVFGGILTSLFSRATIIIFQALAQNPSLNYFNAYATHLQPISLLLSLLGVEIAIWVFFLNRNNLLRVLETDKAFVKVLLGIWGILGALSFLSIFLKQNFKEVILGGLGGPSVPLLEWQILLAWLLSTITILYGHRIKAALRLSDTLIAIIIWVIAAILWTNQPVNPGFAARAPMVPNFEIYPFSDAQLYDQNSQSILIGKGMAGEQFPARPIYVVFLAFAHALVGQDYTRVIALQTLFFSAFPAILYLLGKEISGRPLGVAIATLAILRDITINAVAHFTVSVTYSKLFLSEFPVAMLLSLFTLLSIKWLKDIHASKLIPIIAGGIIGIATLIRTQSIIALFPVLIVAFINSKKDFRKTITQIFFLILGVSISLSPWLYRNWKITGGIVFDNPLSQMSVLAVRYSEHKEHTTIPHLDGENDSEYSNRMLKIAIERIYANPLKTTVSISNHFFQNLTGSLLTFPIRKNLPSETDLFIPTSNFWEGWDTEINPGKNLTLLFYILIFGIGIATAWRKLQWLGLLPLGINLFYNLWTAMFLASGIRLLFPIDWVFYLYQMLGIISITSFIFLLLGTFPQRTRKPESTSLRKTVFAWRYAAIFLIFLTGISLPLSEIVVPDQYPQQPQTQMWDEFTKQTVQLSPEELNTILINHQQELTILKGRAIYPRYFPAGEGFPLTDKVGYGVSEQSRLVFELVGQRTGRVIFPLAMPPAFFPNTADVTIIAKDGSLQDIWLIFVSKNGQQAIYTAAPLQKLIDEK